MGKLGFILKKALKAVLVLIGGLLVLGGGVCAATNLLVTIAQPSAITLTGILLAVCVVAVVAGWAILKATGVVKSGKPQQTGAD